MRAKNAVLVLAVLVALSVASVLHPSSVAAGSPTNSERTACALVSVVDGDTIVVSMAGAEQTVRLQCVDTEESQRVPGLASTKPVTDFGIYTAGYATGWFAPLPAETSTAVELETEPGQRQMDAYGRLLAYAHVRGENFCLKLVREGWSPYFNKYGHSTLYRDEFIAAQKAAQRDGLGIWATTPSSEHPPAGRPYSELLPWWDARAQAIDRFRALEAAFPGRVLEVARDLDTIRERCAAGAELTVFGAVSNVRSVRKGNLWLEFEGVPENRFIVFVPAAARNELDASPLNEHTGEFKQNYLYFSGRGQVYHGMAEMVFSSRDQISEYPAMP